MKKQIIWVCVFLVGVVSLASAAPKQNRTKIINTRIVQASTDTTVTYAGMKVFVPQGKTIILGQYEDGSVVLRGQNIDGVKINNATVSFPGAAVLSVTPKNQIITVNRGEHVSVTDGNGRTAVLSQGASVSTLDIRTTATPVLSDPQATEKAQKAVTKAQKKVTKQEAKEKAKAEKASAAQTQSVEETSNAVELPAFVASTTSSSAASEQAAQNVEETEKTLSPSAPR